MIVLRRCAEERCEGLAPVGRSPTDRARRIDHIRVLRVDLHFGVVAAPPDGGRARIHLPPAFAGVIRSIEAVGFAGRLNHGVDALRFAGRNREPDAAQAILKRRQAASQRLPAASAVSRFEQPDAGTGEPAVLPGRLSGLPQHGVDSLRIGRIEGQIDSAGVFIFVEHLFEGPASVGRAEDAALVVGTVRMSQHGDEQAVRVVRIDDDQRNLLAVAQAEVRPCLACVGGFVDPIASAEVRPLQSFAAADVDDVWIRWRDGQRADRPDGLVVEERRPHAAEVRRLPHPAVDRRHVEDVRLAGHTAGGHRAATLKWADHAPAHLGVSTGTGLWRRVPAHRRGEREQDSYNRDKSVTNHGFTLCSQLEELQTRICTNSSATFPTAMAPINGPAPARAGVCRTAPSKKAPRQRPFRSRRCRR